MNQTVKAMLYSVLATVAVVAVVMMLNPLREQDVDPNINVATTATEAGHAADFTPLAPSVPDSWYANFARWNQSETDAVPYWSVGYVSEDEEFFGFVQTADANSTWINQQVDGADSAGLVPIAGQDFSVYRPAGDHTYLVAELPQDSVTLIVSGTGTDEQLAELAQRLLADS